MLKYGIYHPITNPGGVSRDHMVSRNYGWEHDIPIEVIKHPANCELTMHHDNVIKSANCSITIEELYERIENWKE